MASHFHKTILDNGIRVVSEWQPRGRAAALGIWIVSGTRDEALAQMGVSHLLEHMVFKGTKTRSAFQISKSLEELGGELNAYTTKEYTVYHCLVLKDHWKKGLEVLSDLVSNMKISASDFKLEKSVILQELASAQDMPEDLIHDRYFAEAYNGHPLSWPILGSAKTIPKISQTQVRDYYEQNYSGPRVIVAAAGQVPHDQLVEEVKKHLGKKKAHGRILKRKLPEHKPFFAVEENPSEQLHLLMGIPATSFTDKRRFEAFIVNALLGGGMTSRLYQSVREKKGLAYSIYSSLHTFTDTGLMLIYSAAEAKHIQALGETIMDELKKVSRRVVSDKDLQLFKTQVVGSILLGADDVESRMTSIAVNEMVYGKYKPVDEVIKDIKKVSRDSIAEYLEEDFHLDKMGGLLLGGKAQKYESWFSKLRGV